MASYGPFVTIAGYRYHGPKQRLAFAPRYRGIHELEIDRCIAKQVAKIYQHNAGQPDILQHPQVG